MCINFSLDLEKAFDKAMNFYKGKNIVIHQEDDAFPYITIKNDISGNNIKYCAICFASEGKLIPLYSKTCVICVKRK